MKFKSNRQRKAVMAKYNVYYKKGRRRSVFLDSFKSRKEAETFAGIEGTQMESEGGRFIIKKRKSK